MDNYRIVIDGPAGEIVETKWDQEVRAVDHGDCIVFGCIPGPTTATQEAGAVPVVPRIAVVFVSYRLPESRLREHFEWNHEIYKGYGDRLRVYVVSDVEHSLPDYAETVVFPGERLPHIGGQRRFSLCKTKNAGIAKAIEDGTNDIVCTDVDIAFAFDRRGGLGLWGLDDQRAHIPVYRMAESYAARESGQLDHGCTGTVTMTAANWRRIRYDERCVGYGADDGILLRDIQRAGLEVIRDCEVAHIAHVAGDGQRTPGSGSSTCWNRADGFNFDNFQANRRLHDEPSRRRRRHIRRGNP